MADKLLTTLTQFHREIVLPDVRETVTEVVGAAESRTNGHFDSVYRHLDSLETEYHMLSAGLKRVEDRLDQALEKVATLEGRLGG